MILTAAIYLMLSTSDIAPSPISHAEPNEADRKQAVSCVAFGQLFMELAEKKPKAMGNVTRKDSQKLVRIVKVALRDSQRLSLSNSSLQKNIAEQVEVHILMVKLVGFPTQLQSTLDICGKHYSIY
jgi:hypothetical protein